MKKYIGTKQIEAELMTLGDFVQETGRNPYGKDIEKHEETEQGYHVRYEDGYESWSPKDVFEKAYKGSIRHGRIIMENEWNLIPLVAIAVHIIFFKCLQCIIILINGLRDRESQLIQPLLVDVEQA